MFIEKIVFVKKSKTYTIFIDNGSGFEIVEDTLVRFNLYKGMEIDTELISQIKYENQKFEAANSVFRFIQNKKTTKEVRDYLSRKGYNEEIINLTIEYLISKDYLNDKKYIDAFIHDKYMINKYGQNKIKNCLLQKGIDKDLVESSLYEMYEDIEMENLKMHALKKLHSLGDVPNKKSKLINHLIYKGYPYNLIKKVISNLGDFNE